MRVAITGGSGFVGRAIVHKCAANGIVPRLVSRSIREHPDADTYAGDIVSGDGLARAFDGVQVVIHAAGLAHQSGTTSYEQFARVNAEGCATVARAAAQAGVRRLVVLSSVSVYGGTHPGRVGDERMPCTPTTPYGRSKLEGEQRAMDISRAAGLEFVALRLATVYGRGDPGNVLRLIDSVARHRLVRIGTRSTRKTLIHRDDVAGACIVAATDAADPTGTFNVTDAVFTLDEIVDTITETLGVRALPGYIGVAPARFAAALLDMVPGPTRRLATSLRRWCSDEAYSGACFRHRFGWSPRVSLRAGLEDEIAWWAAGARGAV